MSVVSDEEVWSTLSESLRKKRGAPRSNSNRSRRSGELDRIDTPPDLQSPNLRRSKYKVVPPVRKGDDYNSDASSIITPRDQGEKRPAWKYPQRSKDTPPETSTSRGLPPRVRPRLKKKIPKMTPINEQSVDSDETDQFSEMEFTERKKDPPPKNPRRAPATSLPGTYPFGAYPSPYYWPPPFLPHPYAAPYADRRFPYISVDPATAHFHDPSVPRFPESNHPTTDTRSFPTQSQSLQPLLFQSAVEFYEESAFAKAYTRKFIEQQMDDELLPELLAEALSELKTEKNKEENIRKVKENLFRLRSDESSLLRKSFETPRGLSTGPDDVFTSRYSPFVPPLQKPSQSTQSLFERADPRAGDDLVNSLHIEAAAGRAAADGLIDDVTGAETLAIVKEATQELVTEFLSDLEAEAMFQELLTEQIQETLEADLPAAKEDFVVEMIIEDALLEPWFEELVRDVAIECLQAEGQQFLEKEYALIKDGAQGKHLDGFVLDSIITHLARQSQQCSVLDFDSSTQDGMILDILLQEHIAIEEHKRQTLTCRPIRRFHQNLVADQAMSLLLNSLMLSVDEDMKDLDEYEFGYDVPGLYSNDGSNAEENV